MEMDVIRMDAIRKAILDHPYPALRINSEFTKRERVYGIVKRLRFFLNHIEQDRQRRKLEIWEMKILDVGCGTGVYVTIPLANVGYTILGLDTHLPSAEYGNEFASESRLSNVEFHNSVEQVRPEGPFHVAICSEVLEHLKEPSLLVRQIYHLLVDEGVLLITVPNGYGYFEFESILWRRFPILYSLASKVGSRLVGIENRLRKMLNPSNIKTHHAIQRQEAIFPSTLAPDSGHCQFFTFSQILNLVEQEQFQKIDQENNTFLAGNIVEALLGGSIGFLKWNCWVADFLPYWLCSDWMFAFRKSPRKK